MADAALLQAQANFSTNLLRELASEPGNVAVSPASIIIALSIVYAGAGKSTRKEYDDVLSGGQSGEAVNQHMLAFNEDLKESAVHPPGPYNHYRVASANRVFFKPNLDILPQYNNTVQEFYDGQFEELNFRDRVKAADTINEFVSDHTSGKIKNIVSKNDIGPDMTMALVNALHFKADWHFPFRVGNTHDHPFFMSENKVKDVPTMTTLISAQYYEDEDVQVVSLFYHSFQADMVIILPKEKFGAVNLLNKLDGEKLMEYLNFTEYKEVDLSLPRFKVEFGLDFNSALRKIGFSQGFDANTADFSGITKEKIFIGTVLHKAFVNIDEKGTEAAAATFVGSFAGGYGDGPPKPPPTVMKVDHPFLFLIKEKTNHILFTGLVRNL